MNAENFKNKYFTSSNVAEVTDELLNDLLAVAEADEPTTIEQDITELHNVIKQQPAYKVNGELNPDYTAWVALQVEAKTKFLNKWGAQRLTVFNLHRTLKAQLKNVPSAKNSAGPIGRLQNSKGYGYGNL